MLTNASYDPGHVDNFFAELGNAVFQAQRFEYELVSLAISLRIVSRDEIQIKELLSIEISLSKKTLGQLICEVAKYETLPDQFIQEITLALERRNYLIHRVFAIDAELLKTRNTANQLIMKIKSCRLSIQQATEVVRRVSIDLMHKIAPSAEAFEAEYKRWLDDFFREQ